MIGGLEPVVLDTNVLVHLVRANAVGKKIADSFGLRTRRERPLISIVTAGELRSLALKLNWGDARRLVLDKLVGELVVVQLNQGDILDRYARIDAYSERSARPARRMEKNDIWIAATASAVGGPLLTTDGDFEHLPTELLKWIRVSATTGEVLATNLA